MTVHELQQEILRLKREKNICILAHAYQSQPVLEVADYTGDSYGLSVQAAKTNADGVIMCGVRFMAETCKILSPEKTVWLANPMAGCPMAEQLDLPTLQELKKQYPGYAVVAYINTTSELKTACDVCVTSSSALKICSALENDKILFIPDPNLGGYVAKQLPEKQFAFYHGGCPRHIVCSAADVAKARAAHPEAQITPEEYLRRVHLLQANLHAKCVDYRYHESDLSRLEAVMARGDRRVGQALLEAHRLGCRLDGWDEYFDYEKWLEAFRRAGIDPDFYTTRGFAADELLPWQTIDVGVTTKFLLHEREKALRSESTPDCRTHCNGCGARMLSERRLCDESPAV